MDKFDLIFLILSPILRIALLPYKLYSRLIVSTLLGCFFICTYPFALPCMLYNFECSHVQWWFNFGKWMTVHVMYIIFLAVQVVQLPLQLVNSMWYAIAFWPKLMYHLFGPNSKGPSAWSILVSNGRLRDEDCKSITGHRVRGGRKDKTEDTVANRNIVNRYTPFLFSLTSLHPTQARICLHSNYQVKGAYAALGRVDQDVVDAIKAGMETAPLFRYSADPLRLAVPYKYVATSITEPPDCLLNKIWALAWHIFWMVVFVVTGYAKLLILRFFKTKVNKPQKKKKTPRIRSKFVNKQKKKRKQPLPTLRVKVFMTDHEEDSEPERVTWDTDGITFYVDTCANTIISNCRELFTDLNRMKVTIDTHSGEDVRTRYVGTFRLELPDDDGKIWVYEIPDSIYDPHTDHNILGVARLSNFFKDTAPGDDPMALDGTTATSSAARTHLVWDKRQHELHFMHRTTSHLPELVLYGGNSYFRAFFSRVSRVYDGMVRHAFCTNYTVAPESSYVTDDEGENGMEEDSDDEDDLNREQKWYQPNYCRPCNTPESPFILGQNLILKKKGSDGKSIRQRA